MVVVAEVRSEVVEALVEAHRSDVPWARIAALPFQFAPAPTEAEKADARAVLRREAATAALASLDEPEEPLE